MAENLTLAGAVAEITTVTKGVMEIISTNQLLFTLWACSLFFIGIAAVKGIKKAAKR